MYYFLGYLGVGILVLTPLVYLEIRGHVPDLVPWYTWPLIIPFWPLGLLLTLEEPNDWTIAWRAYQQQKAVKLYQIEADYQETLLLIEYDKYGRYGKQLERSLDVTPEHKGPADLAN